MTGAAASAVALAAAAGAVLPPGRPASLARLQAPDGTRAPAGLLAAALAAAVVAAVAGALPALAAGVAAVVGWRLIGRRSARRAATQRRDRLGELLAALRAELRSGADPRPAMAAAATGLPGLQRLAVAAASPVGDVRRELARLGALPGGRAAADLAAAWQLAELTGCGLAAPVQRVLSAHRADERLQRELAAQLAGPTATARLLTALPAAGVAMGAALGADPIGFLLGPGPGRACLLAGVTLLVLGARWSRSMTRAASATWTGDREAEP
jgi:tight adherence protein B